MKERRVRSLDKAGQTGDNGEPLYWFPFKGAPLFTPLHVLTQQTKKRMEVATM